MSKKNPINGWKRNGQLVTRVKFHPTYRVIFTSFTTILGAPPWTFPVRHLPGSCAHSKKGNSFVFPDAFAVSFREGIASNLLLHIAYHLWWNVPVTITIQNSWWWPTLWITQMPILTCVSRTAYRHYSSLGTGSNLKRLWRFCSLGDVVQKLNNPLKNIPTKTIFCAKTWWILDKNPPPILIQDANGWYLARVRFPDFFLLSSFEQTYLPLKLT